MARRLSNLYISLQAKFVIET